MQYDAETPEAYLAALADDWRKARLLELRALIRAAGSHLDEGMGHGMLRYGDPAGPVFHLNAQKHFVGLYAGDIDGLDPDGALTRGIDRGKTCLRFRKTTALDAVRIESFLVRALEKRDSGEHESC